MTSGRSALPVAFAVKRLSRGRTKLVNVQDPGFFRNRFDLIVVPEHDDLTGPNIMGTTGALGRVTTERLKMAVKEFFPLLAHLPRPRVAVLIGGANAVYATPAAVIGRIGRDLSRLADSGAGLMVTFSRRTGPEMEAAIRTALAGKRATIWDGAGANPYFAYLAMADHLLVSEDSASMVSEAATAGKPVSIVALEGGSAKFARFHAAMRRRGVTRPFDWPVGKLDLCSC